MARKVVNEMGIAEPPGLFSDWAAYFADRYGVQTAVAAGVPLVVAGWSEDKMEVHARVAWSGAGLSLKTRRSPSIAKIGAAVHSAHPSARGQLA